MVYSLWRIQFPSPSGISVLLIVWRKLLEVIPDTFPSPSGISVLLMLSPAKPIPMIGLSVSVPFGDIGSSNRRDARESYRDGQVSVPFGDIGSSNREDGVDLPDR